MANNNPTTNRAQEPQSVGPVSTIVNSPPLSPMFPSSGGFVTVDGERWSDGSDFSLSTVSSSTPSILSITSSMPHTAPQSPVNSIGRNANSRATLMIERDIQTLPADPDRTFSLLRFLTHTPPVAGGTSDEVAPAHPGALVQQQSGTTSMATPFAPPAPLPHSGTPPVEQLTTDMMVFGIQESTSSSSTPTLAPSNHFDAPAAQIPTQPNGETPAQTDGPHWYTALYQDLYGAYQPRPFRGPIVPAFTTFAHNESPLPTAFGVLSSTMGMPPNNASISGPSLFSCNLSPSASHSTVLTDAAGESGTGPDVDSETDMTSVASTVVPFCGRHQPDCDPAISHQPFTSVSSGHLATFPNFKYEEEDSEVILPVRARTGPSRAASNNQVDPNAPAEVKQQFLEQVQQDLNNDIILLESTSRLSLSTLLDDRNPAPPQCPAATVASAPPTYGMSPSPGPKSKGDYSFAVTPCVLFAEPPEAPSELISQLKQTAQVQTSEVSPNPTLSQIAKHESARPRKPTDDRRYSGYGMYTDGSDSEYDGEWEKEGPAETLDTFEDVAAVPERGKGKERMGSAGGHNFILKERAELASSPTTAGQNNTANPLKMSSSTWDHRGWVYSPEAGGQPIDSTRCPASPWTAYSQPLINEAPKPDFNLGYPTGHDTEYGSYHYPAQAMYGATPMTPYPPIPPQGPMDSRLSTSGATQGSIMHSPEVHAPLFLPPTASPNPAVRIHVSSPSSSSTSTGSSRSPRRMIGRRICTYRPASSTRSRSPTPLAPASAPIVSFKLPDEEEERNWARISRAKPTRLSGKKQHEKVEWKASPPNMGHASSSKAFSNFNTGFEAIDPSPSWNGFSLLPSAENCPPRPYQDYSAVTPNPRTLPSIPTQGGLNTGLASTTRGNSYGNSASVAQDSRRCQWAHGYVPPTTAAPSHNPNYNTTPNWYSTPGQQISTAWQQPQTPWTSSWMPASQPYATPGSTYPGMAQPPIAPIMGTTTLPSSTSSLQTANLPFQSTGVSVYAQYGNQNLHPQYIQQPQQFCAAPSYHRHPRFCFPDANISLLIQNTEYRVHRYFFENHSSYMKELLASYPLHNVEPIPFAVSSIDFDRLLSLFYPSDLSEPDVNTIEEWTSVLTLSTLWSFKDLRRRAITELSEKTTPVQRILLSREQNVKEWAFSGYKDLCMRNQPVSLEEGNQLGMKTVLRVWEAQQEIMKRGFCWMNCCKGTIEGIIKTKFELV